jgi:hypothetical protein
VRSADEHKRELRRLRKLRHRELLRRDEIVVPVIVGHELLNFLIDIGHLAIAESTNRDEIAKAIISALSSAMGTRTQTRGLGYG